MASQNNSSILNLLYRGTTTIQNFCWDNMTTIPIYSLIPPEDVASIHDLIMSPRYSGNNKYKMEKIDAVMHYRGFTRFAGGTNRLVYIHPAAPNAVFKVAIDSIGIKDNPAEFHNQHFLKPYCCKVFECSFCGTIASFERVERITTFEEFYSIADDYFYILSRVILGKYVMEDIGTNYFMNVGIRRGCHPVILDFPYLFELDGRKLECSSVLDDGSVCHGEIDYDHGFNKLICTKCGREYRARDLAKPPEGGGMLLIKQGGCRMTIEYVKGGKVVKTVDTDVERSYLSKEDKEVKKNKGLKVACIKNGKEIAPVDRDAKPARKSTRRPKSTGLVVEYVGGTKKVNSEPSKKTQSTPTAQAAPNSVTRVTETPKSPILDSVIAVSFGKTPVKASDRIVEESTDFGLKVEIPSYVKKEEETQEEPEVVVAEEVPEKEPEVEVVEPEATEETPVEEEAVVETSAEEEPETTEEETKPEEESTETESDEAPVEEKEMIQAIIFDEVPSEPEVVKEESSEEEDAIEEHPVRMFFENQLPETLENGVFYCIRTCEMTKEDALAEAEYSDPKEIDEKKYHIYTLISDKPARIVYDFDDDMWRVADEEESEDEITDGGEDSNPEEEEEADEFEVICVDVLPSNSDAEDDTIYCIPEDESVDHFVTFITSDPSEIDSKNYALFMLLGEELCRVTIDEDGNLYRYEAPIEEDEDLEAFKNSAKKKSLD